MNNVVSFNASTNAYDGAPDLKDNKFLIDSFLSTKKSEGTKAVYGVELQKFYDKIKKPFVDVTKWEMTAYVKWLQSKYDNEKTVQRIYSTLRSFYRWLVKMDAVEKDPTDGPIDPLTPNNNPNEHVLTKSELVAMINASKSHRRNYVLMVVLATTGVRVSELVKMNWNDISINQEGNYVVSVIRKGGKQEYVPLLQSTVDILLDYRKRPLNPRDDSPVFAGSYCCTTKRLTTAAVRKIVDKIAREANINRDVTPHWVRHTFASLALVGGAGLVDVQRALGHSDVRTTELYLHPMQNNVAKFLDLGI